MEWLNEPNSWVENGDTISITAEPKTDFWRKTHYGYSRDNGHFRFVEQTGDFFASVELTGNYQDQYDQAGLMLRVDDETWVKCGVELVDGIHYASVVVTDDYSDWSCAPLTANPAPAKIRLSREGDVIMVHVSIEGGPERLIRVARLDDMDEQVQIGVMCASPEGSGVTAEFRDFHVVPK